MSEEETITRTIQLVDPRYDLRTKDRIDSKWRLERQFVQCNVLMASGNLEAFNASVRALLADLPLYIKSAVLDREKEYTKEINDWHYEDNCGARMGTPSDPITSDDKPAKEDWSNVISPRPISYHETDYETLFEIIKEEAEIGGVSWRYDKKHFNIGDIPTVLTKPQTERITNAVVGAVMSLREEGHDDVNFIDAVSSQIGLKPAVPSLRKKGEKMQ